MNYAIALKELISVCPMKEFHTRPEYNWQAEDKAKEQIIAAFDTEIITELNIALFEIFQNTNYLIVVGSKFGTVPVLEYEGSTNRPLSYFLKSGIMYGEVGKTKNQFQFECLAIARRDGVFFKNEPETVRGINDRPAAFATVQKVLQSFYSTDHI